MVILVALYQPLKTDDSYTILAIFVHKTKVLSGAYNQDVIAIMRYKP
jgi:hypothetical protein